MKILVHVHAVRGPIGVWKIGEDGSRESYYKPGVEQLWPRRAEEALDAKGNDNSWEDWLARLDEQFPYFDTYDLTDDKPAESLVSILSGVWRDWVPLK